MSLGDRPWFAYLAISLGVALVLSPLAGKTDSFPLSNYPMFAEQRSSVAKLEQAVGIRADGSEVTLGPKYLGTKEVLQAKAHLERAIRGGGGPASDLCSVIAARAAEANDLGVTRVELRTVTHDAVAYFANPQQKPIAEQVHASCQVVPKRS